VGLTLKSFVRGTQKKGRDEGAGEKQSGRYAIICAILLMLLYVTLLPDINRVLVSVSSKKYYNTFQNCHVS